MKDLLKSTAVLALLFATATVMANDPKISLKTGEDSKSITLKMDAQAAGSQIRLIDDTSKILYFESISGTEYSKLLNLKKLLSGTYFLSVLHPLESVIYTLKVEDESVKISHTEANAVIPVIRKTGDKVTVNLFNADQEKVNIKILDGRDKIVFNQSIQGELTIGKAFNFEKAIKGNYTLIVSDGEDTYYETITVG